MIKLTKTNLGNWFTTLSPNVKFTSGEQLLARFLTDVNGNGFVSKTRYSVNGKTFALPMWAISVASERLAGTYATARARDEKRRKKAAFVGMLEAANVI